MPQQKRSIRRDTGHLLAAGADHPCEADAAVYRQKTVIDMNKPEILQIQSYADFRGWLSVPVDQKMGFHVVQINQGYSKKAFTLRGLHYQEEPYSQAKLVSCLHGTIFSVAVDIRPGESFGYAYGETLSFENLQIIVGQKVGKNNLLCA